MAGYFLVPCECLGARASSASLVVIEKEKIPTIRPGDYRVASDSESPYLLASQQTAGSSLPPPLPLDSLLLSAGRMSSGGKHTSMKHTIFGGASSSASAASSSSSHASPAVAVSASSSGTAGAVVLPVQVQPTCGCQSIPTSYNSAPSLPTKHNAHTLSTNHMLPPSDPSNNKQTTTTAQSSSSSSGSSSFAFETVLMADHVRVLTEPLVHTASA